MQNAISILQKLDIADESITESINFYIDAKSEMVDKQKLRELLRIAEEGCPAMHSMSHIIKVNAKIK